MIVNQMPYEFMVKRFTNVSFSNYDEVIELIEGENPYILDLKFFIRKQHSINFHFQTLQRYLEGTFVWR